MFFYRKTNQTYWEKRSNCYYRMEEYMPEVYRANLRKVQAKNILQRLLKRYRYSLRELFVGWKYSIIPKVVKKIGGFSRTSLS